MSFCNYFDLHCDTIYECQKQKKLLNENDLQLSLNQGQTFDLWVQTFAFWIDDALKTDDAYTLFLQQYDYFLSQIELCNIKLFDFKNPPKKNICNAILSVEGGKVLGGKLEKIAELKKRGISLLTLVWNGDNEIASGAKGSDDGLSEFGKKCVAQLEKENIIVDVSHINEKGFYDVANVATKPFVATHSNSFYINNHKRNLNDAQIKEIILCRGLMGINFFPEFINGKNDCTFDEILRHISHILDIGGENILAIGSDFDGAKMPVCLDNIGKVNDFFEQVNNRFGKTLAKKIFFENANNFFGNYKKKEMEC